MTRQEAINLILQELERAENLWPDWPNDKIHASAIVSEESGELVRATLNYVYAKDMDSKIQNRNNMQEEAIHTGAMAVRFLINL
jgi:hypothetical protein